VRCEVAKAKRVEGTFGRNIHQKDASSSDYLIFLGNRQTSRRLAEFAICATNDTIFKSTFTAERSAAEGDGSQQG
jgi:hypothetical protein